MVWTDKQVEETIYRILDAAEGWNWQIEKMTPSRNFQNGLIQIRGERPLKMKDQEDVGLLMEAFLRMESELDFVAQQNAIGYRVTPQGREALKRHHQRLANSSKSLVVIGLSFGTEDYIAITEWAESYNASAAITGSKAAFRDNAYQRVIEHRNEDIDGFLIANCAEFKPSALANLYKQAKYFSFHLYAVERGNEPFGDDDMEETKSNEAVTPIQMNVTVTGNQNIIAANGSTIRDIQNHLDVVHLTNPDIALVLKEFAEAVQKSELQETEAKNILTRIDDLAEQISKKPEKDKFFIVLERGKHLCEYVVAIVAVNHSFHYLQQHSDKLMVLLSGAFSAN